MAKKWVFFHARQRQQRMKFIFHRKCLLKMCTFLHRLAKFNVRLFVMEDFIRNQALHLWGLDESIFLCVRMCMKSAKFIDFCQYGHYILLKIIYSQWMDDNFIRYSPSVCGFCVRLINGNDFWSATGWKWKRALHVEYHKRQLSTELNTIYWWYL